jgi:RNA polymerase sigma-70 factor (ECF subfamily)
VRLHQSAVRQFLRRLTGNDWSRADDLAQDTFWRAYRHIGGYQARGRFLSWLFGIAYQLFVTSQRRTRGIVEVALPDDVAAAGDPSERLVDRRTFDQLMATLRADERAAIVLHYRHELTHPEIAAALDVPLGTVKSLIRRARLKLKPRLGARESTDESRRRIRCPPDPPARRGPLPDRDFTDRPRACAGIDETAAGVRRGWRGRVTAAIATRLSSMRSSLSRDHPRPSWRRSSW